MIFGAFSSLLVVMAIFLLMGKGAFLIAGYNTLSQAEKARFDEKAICRFFGWLLIIIAVLLMLIPTSIITNAVWMAFSGVGLILAVLVFAAIYSNTGNRFQNKAGSTTLAAAASTAPTSSRKSKPKVIVTVITFALVVMVGIGILFYQGTKDPTVSITNSSLEIKSMYGVTVDFAQITDVSLIDQSMRDLGIADSSRTNGIGGIGDALKGYFRSPSLGDTLLFVQASSSPTIRIERSNGQDIYISLSSAASTRQLYNEIKVAVAK